MNKDVIYIEPENDITDIIAKIENAKERIVAIIPPKNAEILHSIVNIKLLKKTADTNEKTIVLVTTDKSIVKLAAATHIPVTKNLQSAPSMPQNETESSLEETEAATIIKPSDEKTGLVKENDTDTEKTENDKDNSKVKSTGTKHSSKFAKSKIGAFIKEYRRWVIAGGICLGLFILIVIWALIIAPAVNISVSIRTSSNNFSENITFTTKIDEEDATIGKFYLEEKKAESPIKLEFKATGTKNIGDKATGKVNIFAYFKEADTINIPKGTKFTNNGLVFESTTDASLAWDFNGNEACRNRLEASLVTYGCQLSTEVPIIATEPGTRFNINAKETGWTTTAKKIQVYSSEATNGGTDKIATVIQQSDIDKAKESIKTNSETEMKEKLFANIDENYIVIDSSFNSVDSEATCEPKIGEEVKDGVAPMLSITTTATIFVIDKTKVEEFIGDKVRLADDQKIYRLGDPFIENFLSTGNGYTGKLKTSYETGPKVTEEDIMNKSKGKKIGEVQSTLKSINGVNSVSIDKSFFWVNAVPSDPNKITINLTVED